VVVLGSFLTEVLFGRIVRHGSVQDGVAGV
jgi:hypothetical protein